MLYKNLKGWKPTGTVPTFYTFYTSWSWSRSRQKKEPEPVKNGPAPQYWLQLVMVLHCWVLTDNKNKLTDNKNKYFLVLVSGPEHFYFLLRNIKIKNFFNKI